MYDRGSGEIYVERLRRGRAHSQSHKLKTQRRERERETEIGKFSRHKRKEGRECSDTTSGCALVGGSDRLSNPTKKENRRPSFLMMGVQPVKQPHSGLFTLASLCRRSTLGP